MSVTIKEDGTTVHYPTDRTKFVFDGEVARIFDDMALRSIPLFYESHAHHARLAAQWFNDGPANVIDIGASRGAFLREIEDLYGLENHRVQATDYSEAMVTALATDFPMVEVTQVDVTSRAFLSCLKTYNVINFTYVLQFIEPALQRTVLAKVCNLLRPGGVLFIGQKVQSKGTVGQLLHDQYIEFRLANGYTMEEIEAKTAALANSMWPLDEDMLVADLKAFGMREVMRTSSWGVFSNFMCIKQ